MSGEIFTVHTKKNTSSSASNKGFKLRLSSKREGIKKKSRNKWGYLLGLLAGNFGSIGLKVTPELVIIAPVCRTKVDGTQCPQSKSL
jgi:hypothetical protein